MSFYTEIELQEIGFKSIGRNCKISKKVSLYGTGRISVGDDVRIDDFCVLSAGHGGIEIHGNVHVAVNASLIGAGKITLEAFSNISSRVAIYSSTDDFSGEYMTNPTVDPKFTNVQSRDVVIGRHVVIGSGSVVLPGVTIGEGSAVGALSLVKESVEDFVIVAGTPAKFIKKRSTELLRKEELFLKEKKK